MDEEIEDPSTEGVGGLKGLKGVNQSSKESPYMEVDRHAADYVNDRKAQESTTSKGQDIGFAGVNDSHLDTDITSASQLNNIENFRGEDQSGIAQIVAGVAKAGVLAASTFLDNTIGTIVGVGNLAAGAIQGDMKGSDFWNNPFSRSMQAINEWSEKAIPNYYTDKEKNEPWYDNILSTNFIGDKVIKNFGFAVGAMYTGSVLTGAISKAAGLAELRNAFKGATLAANGIEGLGADAVIQAAREGKTMLDGVQLTSELAKDAAKIKKAGAYLEVTGSLAGAVGEGKIEALNNYKDFRDMEMKNLDAYRDQELEKAKQSYISAHKDFSDLAYDEQGNPYLKLKPQYEQQVKDEVERNIHYKQAVGKITDDALKMGNLDFVLNIPLLATSDAIQFGKLYSGGFNTAKKAMIKKVEGQAAKGIKETVGEEGKRIFVAGAEKAASYAAEGTSLLGMVGKALKNAAAEGTEEQLQQVAADLGGNRYASELNNFYGKKINPDSEKETISWMKATGDAMLKNYGTVDGWENFAIGSLTAVVGTPMFRGFKNSEGKFQSPITMEGGVRGEFKELKEENEDNHKLAEQMNQRIQSPEFLNYYQHAIRDKTFEKEKEAALNKDDNFEYKNAEHGQLISDIVMFNKAGRIQDLYDMIESANNTSPENVDQVKQMMANKDTKESPYDDKIKVDGKDEAIEFVKKRAAEQKETIDKYRKISDDIQVKYGDKLSQDGVEEMTYMLSHVDNLEGRFKSLMEDTQKTLKMYSAELERDNKDGRHTDEMEFMDHLVNTSPSQLIRYLSDPEQSKRLDRFKVIGDYIEKRIPELKTKNFAEDMKDLSRIMDKRNNLINDLTTYMDNPKILTNKIDNLKSSVLNEEINKTHKDQKDKLINSQNLQEYRQNLNEVPEENQSNLVDELDKEGHPLSREHKAVERYNKDVNDNIDQSNAPEDVKQSAKTLLKGHYDNSNSLQDLQNHNSYNLTENSDAYNTQIYDPTISDEENNTHLVNTQYHLFKAMSEANSNQKFAEDITENHVESEYDETGELSDEEGYGTTGDDPTPILPFVTVKNTIIENTPINSDIKDVEVLDETFNDLSEEKQSDIILEDVKDYNNEIDSQFNLEEYRNKQLNNRPYYRPAIPEVHIEESKKGDFRNWDTVVQEKEGKYDGPDVYNYLKKSGAFDYVNEGKLKENDKIGFVIDPFLSKDIILMVSTKDNQIVGSIDQSKTATNRYLGLNELIKRIKEEYKSHKGDGPFIAIPTTEVSQIMLGKIPYTSNTNNLQSLLKDKEKGNKFAIVKNGKFFTNGEVNSSDIVTPKDMDKKEGLAYILIKNSRGTYSPMGIMSKKLSDIHQEDIIKGNSVFNSELNRNLDGIISSTSEQTLSPFVDNLQEDLYMKDIYFKYNEDPKNGDNIRIFKLQRDDQGRPSFILDESGKRVNQNEWSERIYLNEPSRDALYSQDSSPIKRDPNIIKKEILDTLIKAKAKVQINAKLINKGNYNEGLIKSGNLISNLSEVKTVSSWFTTKVLNSNNEIQDAFKFKTGEKTSTKSTSIIKGEKVNLRNTEYTINLEEGKFYKDGKKFTPKADQEKVLIDLAWANQKYGNLTEGVDMINNKILTENGEILDRNTGLYLEGKDAQEIKDKLNPPKESESNLDILKPDLDEEFEDEGELRAVDNSIKYEKWDQEKELNWLNKVLPQLQEQDLVKIHKGLINAASQGTQAWGKFKNGIVTLSDIAAKGTTYHEAFRSVFNVLLNPKEQSLLLEEAKLKYGDLSNKELQTKLASGFREYVMSKDEQSLGNKIIKFFKELYAKVKNWKSLTPHIDAYYSSINSGNYSEEKYQIDVNKEDNINQNNLQNSSNKINFADIDSEVKDLMKEKGITQEMFDNLLRDEQDILINCI